MSARPIPTPQKANPKVTRKIGTYGTSEQCMIQMNCRGKEGNGTLSLGYTIVNVYRWTCQGRSEPNLQKPSSFPVNLTNQYMYMYILLLNHRTLPRDAVVMELRAFFLDNAYMLMRAYYALIFYYPTNVFLFLTECSSSSDAVLSVLSSLPNVFCV